MHNTSNEQAQLLKVEVSEIQEQFTNDFLAPLRCAENLEPLEKVLEASLFMVDDALVDGEYLQSVYVFYQMYKQMRLLAEYCSE
jgi:hypothetical protein